MSDVKLGTATHAGGEMVAAAGYQVISLRQLPAVSIYLATYVQQLLPLDDLDAIRTSLMSGVNKQGLLRYV